MSGHSNGEALNNVRHDESGRGRETGEQQWRQPAYTSFSLGEINLLKNSVATLETRLIVV